MNTIPQPTAGRQSWYRVSLLTAGHFSSDFYANFLPALLPVVIASHNLSLTLGGLLMMVFSIFSNMLQPICGYFIDKNGYTWLLLTTLPVSAAFICFSGLASTTVLLFAAVAGSGIAASLFHPLASSLVGRTAPNGNKGTAMSIFIGGGNLGFALAPALITYFLVHYHPANLPWLIVPALMLTVLLYTNKLHTIDLAVPAQRQSSAQPWYRSKDILILNIVMALRSWPQVAVLTFLPVLLTGGGHAPSLAGNMLTVFLLGATLGGLLGGYACDRAGYKKCVIAALILCLPPAYFFLTADGIGVWTWLALALYGAALQGTVPASIVWAQAILPQNAAMVSGMMLGLSFGFGGIGAAITGAMADFMGLEQALLWTLAPLMLSVVLSFAVPEKQEQAERSTEF